MSTRARVATLVVVTLCVVGFWAWRNAGSPEEREIRRRLNELAGEFNGGTTDGIGTVARAARLGGFFTPDVVVDLGRGSPPIHGRDTLMGMAVRLQPRTAAYTVEFADINVELADHARADVVLTLVMRRQAPGEASLDAREFSVDLLNDDGTWRISRVAAIDTLR